MSQDEDVLARLQTALLQNAANAVEARMDEKIIADVLLQTLAGFDDSEMYARRSVENIARYLRENTHTPEDRMRELREFLAAQR